MKTSNTQQRGNCQCCGRLQAVTGGAIAKHGYEVKSRGQGGWFHGVCGGHQFAPIQIERRVADTVVATVRKDAAALRKEAAKVKTGKVDPTTTGTRYDATTNKRVDVPFLGAPKHAQDAARRELVYKLESRAQAGESFARDFAALIERVHGQPLQQVAKPTAPPRITSDDKRISSGRGELSVRYVDGANVHWKDTKGFKGRMSSRAWRALPVSTLKAAA